MQNKLEVPDDGLFLFLFFVYMGKLSGIFFPTHSVSRKSHLKPPLVISFCYFSCFAYFPFRSFIILWIKINHTTMGECFKKIFTTNSFLFLPHYYFIYPDKPSIQISMYIPPFIIYERLTWSPESLAFFLPLWFPSAVAIGLVVYCLRPIPVLYHLVFCPGLVD